MNASSSRRVAPVRLSMETALTELSLPRFSTSTKFSVATTVPASPNDMPPWLLSFTSLDAFQPPAVGPEAVHFTPYSPALSPSSDSLSSPPTYEVLLTSVDPVAGSRLIVIHRPSFPIQLGRLIAVRPPHLSMRTGRISEVLRVGRRWVHFKVIIEGGSFIQDSSTFELAAPRLWCISFSRLMAFLHGYSFIDIYPSLKLDEQGEWIVGSD
ncbi:hypothetical protein DENSPDRAFT_855518 [Dentipellis sp. KUC8613]|nr:hypothetical protein DENSPDRAFT_855518 [Dentipellis sp. KUC8613]